MAETIEHVDDLYYQSAGVPVPERKRRGPKPGSEEARRGGLAVRAKYGNSFFSEIGGKGGRAAREAHGADFYSEIGKKGGDTTRDKLGTEFYERIGKWGGLRSKKNAKVGSDAG